MIIYFAIDRKVTLATDRRWSTKPLPSANFSFLDVFWHDI